MKSRTYSTLRAGLGALALAATLAGCSTIPKDMKLPEHDGMIDEATQDWGADPAVRVIPSAVGMVVRHPFELPPHIADFKLSLSLKKGATLGDLTYALARHDLPIVLGSDGVAAEPLRVPRFDGTLKELLATVSAISNVAYEWRNGVLLLTEQTRYVVSAPQHEDLLSELEKTLGNLGAKEVNTSRTAGIVTYLATPARQSLIQDYIDRLSENAALVTLQVAVVTVSLNREKATGFDWSSLRMAWGDVGLTSLAADIGEQLVSGGGESSDEDDEDSSDDSSSDESDSSDSEDNRGKAPGLATTPFNSRELVSMNGRQVGIEFGTGRFSMRSFINLLSTYGNTKTTQNARLSTLSGTPVELRSGQTVPYVSKVSAITEDSDGDQESGGAETEKLETGLTLTIEPVFDAASRMVTAEVGMELKSLLGWIDLSAGNSVGKLTQPSTQDQVFNNVVRLRAGSTTVLGGIVYDEVADNRATLAGLENAPIGSKDGRISRNAMFIVLRPSVTVYSKDTGEEGGQ